MWECLVLSLSLQGCYQRNVDSLCAKINGLEPIINPTSIGSYGFYGLIRLKFNDKGLAVRLKNVFKNILCDNVDRFV